jgi:glutathione synthase/RimK-type ligase-like ATP-grasp enzyme
MKRIALASCTGREKAWNADKLLVAALADLGVETSEPDWLDPAVNWAGFDLVFVRTTWTWMRDPVGFQAWLKAVDQQTQLLNPLPLITWGLAKTYLPELAAKGLPMVPSLLLDAPDAERAVEWTRQFGGDRMVAKAALGAGAINQHLLPLDAAALSQAWSTGWPISGPALVQPYLPSVARKGELSLIMIEGRASHMVRKSPKSGDYRVQAEYGAQTLAEPISPEAEGIARACLAALPAEPLVARVDLVEGLDGGLLVMECEVVEPELFFSHHPPAATALASAVLARLEALA